MGKVNLKQKQNPILTNTERLDLFKYNVETSTDTLFSIEQALNDNWEKIDHKCVIGFLGGDLVTKKTYTCTNPTISIRDYYTSTNIGVDEHTFTFSSNISEPFTKHGQLVDQNNIISNFSTSNYLSIPPLGATAILYLKVKITDNQTKQGIFGADMSISVYNGYLGYNSLSSDGEFRSVVEISPNTWIYLKIEYKNNYDCYVYYNLDGTSNYISITPPDYGGTFSYLGRNIGYGYIEGSYYKFNGEVDLNYSQILWSNWLDEQGQPIQLNTYKLAILSGTPVSGDILTVTRVTKKSEPFLSFPQEDEEALSLKIPEIYPENDTLVIRTSL